MCTEGHGLWVPGFPGWPSQCSCLCKIIFTPFHRWGKWGKTHCHIWSFILGPKTKSSYPCSSHALPLLWWSHRAKHSKAKSPGQEGDVAGWEVCAFWVATWYSTVLLAISGENMGNKCHLQVTNNLFIDQPRRITPDSVTGEIRAQMTNVQHSDPFSRSILVSGPSSLHVYHDSNTGCPFWAFLCF